MPPRRGGEERNVREEELRLELRRIKEIMEAMDTSERREPNMAYISERKDMIL